MKKRVLASLAVIAMLGVCTPLVAQDDAGEKRTAPPGTRIAVLNLREVYEKYVGVQEYRKEIGMLEPYQKAKKFHPQVMRGESIYFSNPWKDEESKREMQRELDKLKAEALNIIDQKYREKADKVRKDIQAGIDAVAKAYGFQIVLAHGVPSLVHPADFDLYYHEKADDSREGGLFPVYVDGSVDLTQAVIVALNNCHRNKRSKEK